MSQTARPAALIILDGWGYRDNPNDNAILNANTPNMDRLWSDDCHGLIGTSGESVGLPDGQMGNSEVGHLNLGAGRVVYQDFSRINKAIEDGSFKNNSVFTGALNKVKKKKSALHIMGLLSPGGVHSHQQQIHHMVEVAAEQGIEQIYLHAFLDGRDTPPRSAMEYINQTETVFNKAGVGRIASMVGRYYAMDRDNRWDRVERAYDMLTGSIAEHHAQSASEGLNAAYLRDENDEFVAPTLIGKPVKIVDNDAIIFMNFRADRAREISRVFTEDTFDEFERKHYPKLTSFVMLTSYADSINAPAAFPPLQLSNVLGEYLQDSNLKQLRIAETEKYAHVTFFFSGGIEASYGGEERILIPSPDVATYDLQPEMSAIEVTDKLVAAIEAETFDVIICNFANGDMVGHTGNYQAAVTAVEILDQCIGRIINALDQVKGECIITADHGNAEKMTDEKTGQAHTAHTTGPVPFIYHGRKARMKVSDGILSDIAPTLLHLIGHNAPEEMTGRVLISFDD